MASPVLEGGGGTSQSRAVCGWYGGVKEGTCGYVDLEFERAGAAGIEAGLRLHDEEGPRGSQRHSLPRAALIHGAYGNVHGAHRTRTLSS